MVPLRMLGFLLIMLSVQDTGSTCPSEFNPLVLEPAEITAEYGDLLSVKCSNTLDMDYDMYWRVGDEIQETEDGYSVSYNLSLSEWNMTAQCTIMLNDSLECTKDLEITVYKNPEVFSFIKRIRAADNETEYELQCDVIKVAPVEMLTVRWYKNDEVFWSDWFNSPTTRTPVNVTSVLSVNVSRGERADQFKCVAQLDFRSRGELLVVVSQTHNISAHYAPEFNTSNDEEYILEPGSDNVTLNCEAEANPPPVFDWTCDGVNISQSSNRLTLAPVNDSTNCICTATNYLGNITKEIHVLVIQKTVRLAPEVTPMPEVPIQRDCPLSLTPPELVVRYGDPALVTCNTSAPDVAGMGWEATVGGTGLEYSSNVTWMVENLENWNTEASCFINLNDGYQCVVALPITLYKTPDSVSVSGPLVPMEEGKDYELNCDINNVAPAKNLTVIWYRYSKTVHIDIITDGSTTPVNMRSTLNIMAEQNHNGSPYRCEAVLHLGPGRGRILPSAVSAPFISIVHYKPVIKSCPDHTTVLEGEFSMDMLECETDGNPPPLVVWSYGGELINSSRPLSRKDSGEYIAVVVNDLDKTNTSVHVTVEYKPLFTCNKRYEVEENAKIESTCEPEGLPKPLLTWLKDGKKVDSWTKHDSGEYVLKASNAYGAAEHTLYLDILYAPHFKEADLYKEVIQGENVTLDCDAEGNPPPEIQWKFLSSEKEPTEWRPGATSTTAGVYSCNATNKVGSVTKSVTPVIKGNLSAIPHAVIWGCLILLLILLILILVVFLRSCKKKQGQYSFVPSQIPLSKRDTEGNL